MKAQDIKEGETYMFVATLSEARKHLEGLPFKVEYKKQVWRRNSRRLPVYSQAERVWRFFNADGVGARAEELEPLCDDLPF